MEDTIKQLINEEILKKAARLFLCSDHTFKLLGAFENYVYEVQKEGVASILRFTHSSHRSAEMVEAELHWVTDLANHHVQVARPHLSTNGRFVEVIQVSHTYFTVALFEKAPGQMVKKDSEGWGEPLFREWGKTIGQIHKVTKSYVEPSNLTKRLTWEEDDLLDIGTYLPSDQEKVIVQTKNHVTYLKCLPKDANSYGLIHGDIHPGNFFVHNGELTVFDFDDTMYHWFVSDIAIALYYSFFMVDEDEREVFTQSFMTAFMEGYREENDLDQEWIARIPDFLKLRDITLYAVFYKKLDMDNISEKEVSLLAKLRHRIENGLTVVNSDFSKF